MKIHKNIKKAASLLGSMLILVSSAFMFTSCTSDWPTATVSITFNKKNYSIDYKLNRKFFPQTVQHFIELADGGYYNGLCVHDYDSTGMYTGTYLYNTEEDALSERNYYEYIQSRGLKLTPSVYSDEAMTPETALLTVAGEYIFDITNNDKKYGAEKKGSLVMYHTPIESDVSKLLSPVTVKNSYTEGTSSRPYKDHCATSQFYFSLTSSSSVNKNYTVFADLLNEDAENEFKALTSAIDAFIQAQNYDEGTSGFTEEAVMDVFVGDRYLDQYNLTETYNVPKEPIVINKITITGY